METVKPIARPEPNQLHPELIGLAALHPFPGTISSPRMQMFLSHTSQVPVIECPTRRRLYTGIERELGRFVFDVTMPEDGQIIAVIDQFPASMGKSIDNPSTLVIYENAETREVDCFVIPYHHSSHQHLGFKYRLIPENISKLFFGSDILKGTVFATSPMLTDEGDWMFGRETNIAYLSLPGVIEDGVIISESFALKMKTKGFETRSMSWGEKHYPLNLYGDDNTYKPFPDIGEMILPSGLVFGRREHHPYLAPLEMTTEALREPDYIYDDLAYTLVGEARVVDINVMRSGSNAPSLTPVGMETQADYYYQRQLTYYNEIVNVEKALRTRRGRDLKLSPRFHATVVNAMLMKGDNGKLKIKRILKNKPLDDWRVDLTFEYDLIPNVGFKMTGIHGNKGVVCAVWKDEDMPIDDNGNRAEIIMAPQPVENRMIPGSTYEPYINATSREVTKSVRAMLSTGLDKHSVQSAWDYLMRYYEIVQPDVAKDMQSELYNAPKENHLHSILNDELGVRIKWTSDAPQEILDTIERLSIEFPIPITPVTFRGRSGRVVRTHANVMIGSAYILLLEKTGNDYSAVSTGKVQHFGTLAKLSNQDKYAYGVRPQPVRITDEATMRLFLAIMMGVGAAKFLTYSSDPATRHKIVMSIMQAKQPTNIKRLIDDPNFVGGRVRAAKFVDHIFECQGIEMVLRPDSMQPQTIYYPEENRRGLK